MQEWITGTIVLICIIIVYRLAVKFYQRVGRPYTVPVFVSTFIIVFVLLVFDIPYETFMKGGKWVNELLGPAVVALAYPLYKQRHLLKDLLMPILCGSFVGAVIGISTGVLLAKWTGFDEMIIYSLTPKSVTTPVAMAIASSISRSMSLAAVFVMFAGIGGVMISDYVFKFFRIHHYLGRGIGIGSASHAIGTAKAMESNELEGSISTIAMGLSAIIVSMITPWLIWLLM